MNHSRNLVMFIIGAIIGFLAVMISSIATLLCMIPGLRAFNKIKAEEESIASEAIKGSLPYKTSLSGVTSPDVISSLKGQLSDKLLAEGFSLEMAYAAASLRERLMWSKDKWFEVIASVKDLIAQGYQEEWVIRHFKIATQAPSAAKLDLLIEMVLDQGITDVGVLRVALSQDGYNVGSFEKAIFMHDVDELDWADAVNKSLFVTAGV